MIGCGGYLAGVAASYLSAAFDSSLSRSFGMLGGVAELLFLLWLLIMGARDEGPEGFRRHSSAGPRVRGIGETA
jgi:hypothetical protein